MLLLDAPELGAYPSEGEAVMIVLPLHLVLYPNRVGDQEAVRSNRALRGPCERVPGTLMLVKGVDASAEGNGPRTVFVPRQTEFDLVVGFIARHNGVAQGAADLFAVSNLAQT